MCPSTSQNVQAALGNPLLHLLIPRDSSSMFIFICISLETGSLKRLDTGIVEAFLPYVDSIIVRFLFLKEEWLWHATGKKWGFKSACSFLCLLSHRLVTHWEAFDRAPPGSGGTGQKMLILYHMRWSSCVSMSLNTNRIIFFRWLSSASCRSGSLKFLRFP